ncbi:glycosyltransferase family 34 protein [Tortispora caseinolytica NRRL Y-17796]|uniref:Glycosyltransferase family 34 protein n=1 Tax=Tortispora caseinolytica NRRL Y-17796 TaxID=767744 RepID=A0A1E4TM23_9ASCO|nr:glycosyltransferase family 34 protein [Tortispora caseinolytica NRRL Y-17796]
MPQQPSRWRLNRQKLFRNVHGLFLTRRRQSIALLLIAFMVLFILWTAGFFSWSPFTSSKVVIILATNQGGGVKRWKKPNEWATERSSIENKRRYARRWNYELAVKDCSEKKKYSHEFRESWQRIDVIKQTMRQYPKAEWFWWLDLNTYIMEPQISLDEHIFNHLDSVYRTVEYFNVLNFTVDIPYVDYEQPINMLITQDCGGFNLGSFLIRRSDWTDRLLDFWWDPAMYEQKHMEWEHAEQDALEYLYSQHAWIRSSVGFLPLRKINSFPPGACSQYAGNPLFFYDQKDRDFVVNMAGCDFGRDCYLEMEAYKELDQLLHKKKFWLF